MMVASVISFAAVGLGELDPAVFDLVDGPDMNAIRADHFHMLLDGNFQFLHARYGSNKFIALFGQEVELRLLVGDTLRRQLPDRPAGIGGCLLGQFGEVFPDCGDALVDLSDAQRNVGHGSSPRHRSPRDRYSQGRADLVPFAGPVPTTIGRGRAANKTILRVGLLAREVDRPGWFPNNTDG